MTICTLMKIVLYKQYAIEHIKDMPMATIAASALELYVIFLSSSSFLIACTVSVVNTEIAANAVIKNCAFMFYPPSFALFFDILASLVHY